MLPHSHLFTTKTPKRQYIFVNSFPADVAIKQHLGSAPKSHFCDDRENWSGWLVWPNDSFYRPRVFLFQTDAKSIHCFQKYTRLIENRFSRSKGEIKSEIRDTRDCPDWTKRPQGLQRSNYYTILC
jgi:hypothetical protein